MPTKSRVSMMAICAAMMAVAGGAWAETMVTVGNAGNAPDTRYGGGYGAVAYEYRIGKYEVTNAEYIAFLNAVATVGDPNGLYSTHMAESYGGIRRTGSGTLGDPWVYSAKGGDTTWLKRPVNYVSWYDTLRYANWLHNRQPTGVQDTTTTEDGAYDMSLGSSVVRKAGALFFLPTEHEWYKAAYYEGGGGVYYDYATGSNNMPSNDLIDPDPGNNANFNDSGYTLGSPYYTTLVGEFENSESPYGTFDQAGNLWEWNETLIGSSRGMRGGGWSGYSDDLHASFRVTPASPTDQSGGIGFRVASVVPEPGSVVMLVGLAVMGLIWRWRRK